MKTLAIETSCDDTSLSIVEFDGKKIKDSKLLLYSQIESHKKFWWVVPELASRLHEEKVVYLLEEIWIDNIKNVDFISYTCCPGLPGSLLVWKTLANTLSLFLNKKKVGVNHISWHIFSIFLERNLDEIKLPLLVLTVSGWHNEIYFLSNDNKINTDIIEYTNYLAQTYSLSQEDLIKKIWKFTLIKIWFTLDDAAWEAFDKVSKMLQGPYPWWKRIYDKAKTCKKKNLEFSFPRVWLKKNEFNFSFSWLKAQVNYKIKELVEKHWELSEELKAQIAYEFQEAVVETLWKKLLKTAKYFSVSNIAIVWWVSANLRLREFVKENMEKFNVKNFYTPTKLIYSTDNAAMIWAVGLIKELNLW